MWVPTMDGRRRTTPIILKTLDIDEFDHSASWPSKVRNVSRLGSHTVPLSTPGCEILDNKALPPSPDIRHIPQVFAVGGLSRV